jgi:hypothetical protein
MPPGFAALSPTCASEERSAKADKQVQWVRRGSPQANEIALWAISSDERPRRQRRAVRQHAPRFARLGQAFLGLLTLRQEKLSQRRELGRAAGREGYANALTRARGKVHSESLIRFWGGNCRLARRRPGKGLGGLLIRAESQPTDTRTLAPDVGHHMVQS